MLAGGVLACGFEPVGWAPLLVIGLAALLVLTVRQSVRSAALLGLLFGLGFFGVVLWWLNAVGRDGWVALVLVQSLYFVPMAMATAVVGRLRWWPLWSTSVWIAVEAWRSSWPFGGLAWGRLGFASIDTVWAPILPWLGVTGVGVVIALTAAALAWLVVGGWRERRLALAGGLLLAAGTVTPSLIPGFANTTSQTGSLDVAAIQPGVPGDGTEVIANHREITRTTAALTAAMSSNRPDVVLWPENSTAVDPFLDAQARSAIASASDAVGVPIVLGAMVDGPTRAEVLNQSVVWRPGVGGGDRYTKRHPVPYGEYIPYRGWILPDDYGRLAEIGRDMARGEPRGPLDVAGTRMAAAICFDVSYDDVIPSQVADGAQWISVQTSNAMFIHTPQIDQQFEITRIRALESGRSVVVAAINGVSAIVAPDGTVVETAPPQASETVRGSVVLTDGLSPAMWLGHWPGRLLVAVAAVAVAVSAFTYPRPRRRGTTVAPRRPGHEGEAA